MPRARSVLVLVAAVLVAGAAVDAAAATKSVTVMSRNLYVGFDVTTVLGATTPAEFAARTTAGWLTVEASQPVTRAEAWAEEIAATRPDVVGVQESALYRLDMPADGPLSPATTVRYDFLELLVAALARRGLNYDVAAVFSGADIEAPTALGFDVRLTDRDAILVRADRRGGRLKVLDADAAPFATNLAVPTIFGNVAITRGWTSVDVKLRGRAFRVLNTHLEAFATPIQVAQVTELLTGPGAAPRPTILLGDTNSGPGRPTPTYALILAAGFTDAAAGAGPTCCHAVDLRNAAPAFTQRIDQVFERGRFRALDAEVVGDEQAVRDRLGLWPSDHAGPVATLGMR